MTDGGHFSHAVAFLIEELVVTFGHQASDDMGAYGGRAGDNCTKGLQLLWSKFAAMDHEIEDWCDQVGDGWLQSNEKKRN